MAAIWVVDAVVTRLPGLRLLPLKETAANFCFVITVYPVVAITYVAMWLLVGVGTIASLGLQVGHDFCPTAHVLIRSPHAFCRFDGLEAVAMCRRDPDALLAMWFSLALGNTTRCSYCYP